MTVTYQHNPYQGTIGAGSMKYHKQYQGNISPSKLKYARPYHGSINREDFRPKVYGKMTDRNNAYKYYQLPRDYYDIRTRNRARNLPPAEANNGRQLRDNVPARSENVDRNVADTIRQKTPATKKKKTDTLVKEPPVIAAAAAAPATKQPQRNKPQASTSKPPDPVTPFPPASPEPLKPVNRRDIKITPESVRVRSFADVTKPEPVFPPIMPVSMEDYVRTERTRKPTTPRVRRNPLVPMARPADNSARTNLLRSSRISPILSVPRDSYDSLSRSFTNVPGYSAVGSVLRSLDMYYH